MRLMYLTHKPGLAYMLRDVAMRRAIQIDTCTSAEQALEALSAHRHAYEMLLVALPLLGADPYDVVCQLRCNGPIKRCVGLFDATCFVPESGRAAQCIMHHYIADNLPPATIMGMLHTAYVRCL